MHVNSTVPHQGAAGSATTVDAITPLAVDNVNEFSGVAEGVSGRDRAPIYLLVDT